MNKKIRICFVGTADSVHLKKWTDYFSNKNNFEVFVVSRAKLERDSVNVYYFEDLVPIWLRKFLKIPKVSFLISAIFFRKFLNKLKPDLLHVHQLGRFGTIFALSGYKPMVISVWGSDTRLNVRGYWKLLKIKALSNANIITATSHFLAQSTRDLAGKNSYVKVVPFGVNTKEFDPGKYNKPKSETVTIGFAKHLMPIYGPDFLISAFKNLTNELVNNLELIIAGDGGMESTLKKLVKELKLQGKVKFVGKVPHREMPEFLSKIDIFVMPTVVPEAFGVSALEASAMQVPVIATDFGGIPEIVKNGETGILVKPKDANGLADAMRRLIKDGGLRLKMGNAGRQFVVDNYEWGKNAEQMEKIYRKL